MMSEILPSTAQEAADVPEFGLCPQFPSNAEGWAAFYVVSRKTVDNWKARGKAHVPPMEPPLGAPGEMEEWYRLCHDQRPPKRFLEAVQKAKEKVSPPPPLEMPMAPGLVSQFQLPPSRDIDFTASHQMLQESLAHHWQLVLKAKDDVVLRGRPQSDYTSAHSRYLEVNAAFQKAEQAYAKILEASGKTAAIDDVRAVICELLIPIPEKIERELVKAHDNPDLAIGCDLPTWKRAVRAVKDAIFAGFHEDRLGTLATELATSRPAA